MHFEGQFGADRFAGIIESVKMIDQEIIILNHDEPTAVFCLKDMGVFHETAISKERVLGTDFTIRM